LPHIGTVGVHEHEHRAALMLRHAARAELVRGWHVGSLRPVSYSDEAALNMIQGALGGSALTLAIVLVLSVIWGPSRNPPPAAPPPAGQECTCQSPPARK
jgi:hypothetical protein